MKAGVVWICDYLPPLNLWNFPEWRFLEAKPLRRDENRTGPVETAAPGHPNPPTD